MLITVCQTSIILPCPPCPSCPTILPSSCASGQLTKDNCLCCDVCARAVGEDCGGWVFAGAGRTCADNLYCEYSPLDTQNDFNTGVCKQEVLKGECCKQKVVVDTMDVYTLDLTSRSNALDICLGSCVYRLEGDLSGEHFCLEDGDFNFECIFNWFIVIVIVMALSMKFWNLYPFCKFVHINSLYI